MKILIDAMGGDNSPDEIIKGCVEAMNEQNPKNMLMKDTEIILIGDEKIIGEKVKDFYGKESISEVNGRLSVRHASEKISNHDSPTEAIKKKKDSSMVVGFKMLKEGEGDVMISAGSTGAFMVGGLLLVGRIKGIDRPALCPILPSHSGKGFMLIDSGANTNCRPMNLVQFAQMGEVYMKNVRHVDNPSVGLLNNGAEEGKGNELAKETFVKLSEAETVNFYGNIEGREIFDDVVDVVVTDGFTGNIALKTIEGMGSMITKLLKEELMKNAWSKCLAMLLKPYLKNFKKRMDYSEYGGALLLGIKKPMVKCHGSANAKIVKYTLRQAEDFAKNKVVESIEEIISKEDVKKSIDN